MKTVKEIEKLARVIYPHHLGDFSSVTHLRYVAFIHGYTERQKVDSDKRIEFATWLCDNYGKLDYEGMTLKVMNGVVVMALYTR